MDRNSNLFNVSHWLGWGKRVPGDGLIYYFSISSRRAQIMREWDGCR